MKKITAFLGVLICVALSIELAYGGLEVGSETFYGDLAGDSYTGGMFWNTFIGEGAGFINYGGATPGKFNVFVGASSGWDNRSGSGNIFVGYYTGFRNTTGSSNSFFGQEAGTNSETSSFNTYIGYQSGYNSTGGGNVFIGNKAGYDELGNNKLYISNSETASPLIYGEFDTPKVTINGSLEVTAGGITLSNGRTALPGVSNGNLTSLGDNAGTSGGTGGDIFVGPYAGNANTTGGMNSLIGYNAGHYNTSGSNNTFIGGQAGFNNTQGNFNTFIGSTAGGGAGGHPGSSNVFIGAGTGYNNTGNGNVLIGNSAGYSSGAGNFNVFIGTNAAHDVQDSYRLYISSSNTYPTTPLIYGEFDNKIVQINGKLVFPSDERLKKNIEPLQGSLDKVVSLKGVSYEWRTDANEDRGFGKGREIGLVAQEVEAVIPELVHTDGKGYKSLSYDKLVPVLVEAIKELQKKNDKLEQRLRALEAK
jgi:trimeric autotransporter adhesin